VEDPTFDRHGLTPVTVLNQAMSGLSHLHSLNIGKMNFFFEDCVSENEFQNRRKISLESKHDYHTIWPWTFLVHYLQKYQNTSLISDLTTKNGNKALFILRNRAHSFVAENWACWPTTGPTNEASIFVITREKTALNSR